MKTPTVNIALLIGKESTRKLFREGATLSNLVSEIATGEGGFLFSTQDNSNFISLEHTVNIGESFQITLTFLDPNNEFEKQFLTNNIIDEIGLTFPPTEGSNSTEEIKGQLEAAELRRLDTQVRQISKEIFEYKQKFERQIFLAYGIGKNLNEWAGPFKVIIQSASISLEGARTITLVLVPSDNHLDPKVNLGAYKEQTELDSQGLKVKCAGYSNPIDLEDPKPYTIEKILPSVSNEIRTEIQSIKLDFHMMVVDAIRRYIQNATANRNVIVLLPDLNKICKKQIEKSDQLTSYSSYQDTRNSFGFLTGGEAYKREIINYLQPYFIAGLTEKFIAHFLQSIGLNLVNFNANKVAEGYSLNPVLSDILSEDFSLYIENADTVNYTIVASNLLQITTFKAGLVSFSKTYTPDHSLAINDVINKINAACKGEYNIKYDILVENNLKILDVWNDEKIGPPLYPLFAGYGVPDKDKEFIIMGDVTLIREFLYAANNGDNQLAKFLHPIDRAILLKSEYRKALQDIAVYTPSYFEGLSETPDIFVYEDERFSEEEKQAIKANRIPVFKYNTQNPNIVDITINDSNQYWTLLKGHYFTQLERKATGKINGFIPKNSRTFKIDDINSLSLYAANAGYFNQGIAEPVKKGIVKALEYQLDDKFKTILKGNDPEFTLDAVSLVLDALSDDSLGLSYIYSQGLGVDPRKVVQDFLTQLYAKVHQVNITTLPMFSISNLYNLTRPCLVLITQPNVPKSVQSKITNQEGNSNVVSMYSGLYRIQGFKHTISSSECNSEFFLQKIIQSKPQETVDNTNTNTNTTPVPDIPSPLLETPRIIRYDLRKKREQLQELLNNADLDLPEDKRIKYQKELNEINREISRSYNRSPAEFRVTDEIPIY